MFKILPLFLITLLLISCETKKKDKYQTKDNETYFNTYGEVIQDFKHNRIYINPLVIYSFFPYASDRFSYWQEIDLTAADNSNRFHLDGRLTTSISKVNNRPIINYIPKNVEDLDAEFSAFSYVYLGRLNNGVELIEYTTASTGSYIYNGLIGFSFSERKVAGDSSEHIFMRKEKSYGLQQYCKFELDKENNRVLVKPYENMMQADFVSMPKDFFYVNFPKEATEGLKMSLKE